MKNTTIINRMPLAFVFVLSGIIALLAGNLNRSQRVLTSTSPVMQRVMDGPGYPPTKPGLTDQLLADGPGYPPMRPIADGPGYPPVNHIQFVNHSAKA